MHARVDSAITPNSDLLGQSLAMPARKRLKKEFPRLTEAEADEVLHHVALISKTVWSLAESGGETKLKKENVISDPGSSSVPPSRRIEASNLLGERLCVARGLRPVGLTRHWSEPTGRFTSMTAFGLYFPPRRSLSLSR